MTLESQYKKYLKDNPGSKLTYEQWMKQVLYPKLMGVLEKPEPKKK